MNILLAMKIGTVLKFLGEVNKVTDNFKAIAKDAAENLNVISNDKNLDLDSKGEDEQKYVLNNINRIAALIKNVTNTTQDKEIIKDLEKVGIMCGNGAFARSIIRVMGIENAYDFEIFKEVLQEHADGKGLNIESSIHSSGIHFFPEVLGGLALAKNDIYKTIFNIRGGSIGKGELLSALMFTGGKLNKKISASEISLDAAPDENYDNTADITVLADGKKVSVEIKGARETFISYDLRYENKDKWKDDVNNANLDTAIDKFTIGGQKEFFDKIPYLVIFHPDCKKVLILHKGNIQGAVDKGWIKIDYPKLDSKFANRSSRYSIIANWNNINI